MATDPSSGIYPLPSPTEVVGHEKTWLPVLLAGMATTAAALAAAWFSPVDWNTMGSYANYVVPVGAMLVGFVAGSGYGVASWLTGVRISGGLLVVVVVLQVLAYLAAQFLDFLQGSALTGAGGQQLISGFLEYFDATTRSFSFETDDGEAGVSLGAWGYAFRLLEVSGFAAGGLIAPLLFRTKAYCAGCQVYKRSRLLALLPAGLPPPRKKKDVEGRKAFAIEQERALGDALEVLEQLVKLGVDGRTAQLEEHLEAYRSKRKDTDKLTTRIELRLVACPCCSDSELRATALTGRGENLQRRLVGAYPVHRSVGQLAAREPQRRGSGFGSK